MHELVFDYKTRALHGVRGAGGGTPYDSHSARGGSDITAFTDARTFGRLLILVVITYGPVAVSGPS